MLQHSFRILWCVTNGTVVIRWETAVLQVPLVSDGMALPLHLTHYLWQVSLC